ncbi:MAG TPA: VOC family protein [Dehalococcoidia bacterium]|jgi:catechol 2,3-dioxygenase-like lactoylglutathione lyase family enzyme|nr:VOC family protein [Dehalococcoidia bacterium]|tara:strand:+ start:840 stop:1298 length:459 start_codon:yes stop_codon:yes gene_type:complete
MDAIGMSHIAICVRDMDKSLGFYRDILGMEVTFDGPTDPTEGGRPHNYKHARKTRRRVSLSSGEGVPIPSLTLTSHPGEEPDGNPILLDQVGITHFSITVADVNALAEELISKGVEPAGPKESFINAEGKFRYIYVRDPDGILIQFDSGGAG